MVDQHCPGFESNKKLQTFLCKCDKCEAEIEVFSDELEKKTKCKCGNEIDTIKCRLDASA